MWARVGPGLREGDSFWAPAPATLSRAGETGTLEVVGSQAKARADGSTPAPPAKKSGVRAVTAPRESRSPARIVLVVEDAIDNREMVVDYLNHHGFATLQAESGERALELARDLRPGLVLLDLTLPDVDGLSVARQLKRDRRTKGIRIVALTGHVDADTQEEAKRAGCDGFLGKPALPDEILSTVRKWLDRAAR